MSDSNKQADKSAVFPSVKALTTVSAMLAISAVANGQDAAQDSVPAGAEAVEEVLDQERPGDHGGVASRGRHRARQHGRRPGA